MEVGKHKMKSVADWMTSEGVGGGEVTTPSSRVFMSSTKNKGSPRASFIRVLIPFVRALEFHPADLMGHVSRPQP